MLSLSCTAPVVGTEVWAALLRMSAGTQQLSLAWSDEWKSFSVQDTSTGVFSAGKTSESQLAEHHKIVLVCSSRFLWKDKQQLRGNNLTKVWCSLCWFHWWAEEQGFIPSDIYRMINGDNNPAGREIFEVPGLVLQNRWHQILLTCATKLQTQKRNEAFWKAECILLSCGRHVPVLEAQSHGDVKARLEAVKHFVGSWLYCESPEVVPSVRDHCGRVSKMYWLVSQYFIPCNMSRKLMQTLLCLSSFCPCSLGREMRNSNSWETWNNW